MRPSQAGKVQDFVRGGVDMAAIVHRVCLLKRPFLLPVLMWRPTADTLLAMMAVLVSLLLTVRGCVRSRAALQFEGLALRHQLQVLARLRLSGADRWLWVWCSRVSHEWRAALVFVKPETVIAWHRRGFRLLWTWKSHRRLPSAR